ncbi:MAG: DNA primase [Candidatus Pacebacteria bacterium]|nr:DNA primase [Candidatus Paceibacterota bacterium]
MAAAGKSNTVEQIKARLTVVDVVSQYVKLARAGASYKGRCPFHSEKTPSFIVSPDRGTYHCFGCGVGGDILTFVQEVEGIDFKGALKILAERAGVPLVYERGSADEKDDAERLFAAMEEAAHWYSAQLTKEHPAYSYLTTRGLHTDTIEHFRIGWAPDEWRALSAHLKGKGFTDKELLDAGLTKEGDKGNYDRFRSRVMFPLFDTAGRVIAFSGRIFVPPPGKPPEDIAKYMNSPETPLFKKSRVLYGFDRAKQAMRKLNFATLVEGQMDLVMVHQAGWHNTVAVSGTALTPEHIALVRRMTDNLLLALDADDAGIAAAGKSAAIALSQGMDVKVARLPEGMDPADVILKEGKEAWGKAVKGSKHIIEFLLDVLSEKAADKRAFVKSAEKTVLPFVARIASAMDRDHFVQRVAERLGVSEESVREAVRKTDAPLSEAKVPERAPAPVTPQVVLSPRLIEARGLIAWQQEKTPGFDVGEAQALLARAVGSDVCAVEIPPHVEEAARYKVETQYADIRRAREAFDLIVKMLTRERLQKEYQVAQVGLREAEVAGDEGRLREMVELCTGLSAALAKLS